MPGVKAAAELLETSVYLRGKGKDLYNMYLFKYGGVDQATGLPLFASTVSSSNIDKLQKASHVYGDIKEGNVVYTTDYSLATRQEFGSATPKFIGGFSTSVPLERPRLRGYVRIPVRR